MLAWTDYISRHGLLGERKQLSPKGDITCAGRTHELVSGNLTRQVPSSSHVTTQRLRVFICEMGGRSYHPRSRDGKMRQWVEMVRC